MSAITFTADFTGAPDDYDREAAIFAIETYNRRAETPLPYATGAELRASYLILLEQALDNYHLRNQRVAAENSREANSTAERWRLSTPAQRAAALAELAPLPSP